MQAIEAFIESQGGPEVIDWREVTLGAAAEGLRIVTSGLEAGEQIVVNGLQRIRPGATLAPEQVPMAERSELKKPATELAQR